MLDEVATLFRDLRRVLGKSAVEIAAELGAPTQAIVALEHGHLALLPPWPETARIVREYTAMAGIDPRPALIVLEAAFAEYESNLATVARSKEDRIAQAEWVPVAQPRQPEPAPGGRFGDAYSAAIVNRTTRQPVAGTKPAPADYRSEPLARLAPYDRPANEPASPTPLPHGEFIPARLPFQQSEPAQTADVRDTRQRAAGPAQTGIQSPASSPSWRKGRSGMPVPAPASVPAGASLDPTNQPDVLEQHEEASAWAHFTQNLARVRPRLAIPPARIAVIAGLVVGLPLVAAAVLSQSAFVAAATTHLPGPLASIVRSSHDFLIHRFADTREGMRWIEVDEPRARRTDKLPARGQSD